MNPLASSPRFPSSLLISVKAEDMQNEKLNTVDYRGTWNRITPWLPWMLMGQMPGHITYSCFMGTCDSPDQVLHRSVVDYAEKNYKKFFTAPTEFHGFGKSFQPGELRKYPETAAAQGTTKDALIQEPGTCPADRR
ncbi:MAG: DUF1838 family protein [Gammaproteobacteria bacterium]